MTPTHHTALRRAPTLIALAALVTGCGSRPATATGALTVSTAAERPTVEGSAEYFTGAVRVEMLFAPQGARDFGAARVTFEPGARSAWHSHPAGQTLVVTEGTGWVQTEGGERREIKPGDVVWTPPGVRHWHGATRTTAMTHLALQGALDGRVVEWAEHVDDTTYDNQGDTHHE